MSRAHELRSARPRPGLQKLTRSLLGEEPAESGPSVFGIVSTARPAGVNRALAELAESNPTPAEYALRKAEIIGGKA